MEVLALIGASASGKTSLALEVALENNCIIMSLDSLSIYKEIDIASAKPSKSDLNKVKHFGIDVLYPNENASAKLFCDIYLESKKYANSLGKNLLLVGGSGFYLKCITDGLSYIPVLQNTEELDFIMSDLEKAYSYLHRIDSDFASKISANDKYRINKAISIYLATNTIPSEYFNVQEKVAIDENIMIFELEINIDENKNNIAQRTKEMLYLGLIDEVAYLESKYNRNNNAMRSIGIQEVLDFFDSKISRRDLEQSIITHTNQLAKRQRTFNRTQFNTKKGNREYLRKAIYSTLNS